MLNRLFLFWNSFVEDQKLATNRKTLFSIVKIVIRINCPCFCTLNISMNLIVISKPLPQSIISQKAMQAILSSDTSTANLFNSNSRSGLICTFVDQDDWIENRKVKCHDVLHHIASFLIMKKTLRKLVSIIIRKVPIDPMWGSYGKRVYF